VDRRHWRATGFAIFLVVFTPRTVASSRLRVGKGENVLGGRNETREIMATAALPLQFYLSFTTFLLLGAALSAPASFVQLSACRTPH